MLGKSIVDSASFTATTTLILITAAVVLAEHSTTAITKNDADVAVEIKNRPKSSVFLHERDNFDKYQDLNGEGKHLRDSSYVEHLLADEFEKRASMRGFQGMRGKKSDYNLPHEYQNSEPSFGFESLDYYDKRAPMGFHGMRGKKTEFAATYGDNELDKRAPMGFQGMRGKKSLETVLDELEKRAMLGFQGMRGKKAEEYEEQRQRQLIDSPWHNKRAPSMGFHGMRGKKNEFLDELDQLEKRALLGFHGMRGKKDMYENDDAQLMDFDGYVEKRPMMMGFHGMRGKRSINYYGLTNRVDESSSSRYEKRSPYWYFGTRGKKNPRWEMRGKFVGVRGKKWISAPGQLKPSYYVATNDELEDNEENDDNVLELFDHSDRIAGSTTRH